ncbi:Molybdopterin molybdenumtransferase [Aquimixticola soesokkakensis]|uniref:Molybdopterin molybdenumtransferase n=1 Tax=Aquimixticola soesokkakensis TaxID=1519096 RepID=A0A1Y5TMX2_9RHOB|nr:gephyrin-like molybdotransferase Glp [Aquimixticola soesokkakensis]SLN65710.1 Molybdopterin molybdenumtransferase [Aquimixticola soesokkakensis]
MIAVEEARARILDLVARMPCETVGLRAAHGRVLAQTASATRDQPPFAAAMMDGYAVRGCEVAAGARFEVIGEAAAGHGFDGALAEGQAVRIFTGAPLPRGADHVIIQEDVARDGDAITLLADHDTQPYVRALGADFKAGDPLAAPRLLTPALLALLAAMNVAQVTVYRRPRVALIATGDELVMPGEVPNPAQIIASNAFGLAAQIEAVGGIAQLLPIARDTPASLNTALDLAQGADVIVTIGGASVGDHDIVGRVASARGLERAFWKVAMRPGKPLMAGKIGETPLIGLPGNPVSALVCGLIFLAPALRKMQGLEALAPQQSAILGEDLPANGPRAHYMRARLKGDRITPFARQDSALLSILSEANALLIRPADDPAKRAGDSVAFLPL